MIKLPSVIISAIRTLADRTLRITLDLPELTPSQMADIFIAFKGGEEGVEIEEVKVKGIKSQSQRLRNTLYRVWEQTTKESTSEDWIKAEMERMISHYQDKL